MWPCGALVSPRATTKSPVEPRQVLIEFSAVTQPLLHMIILLAEIAGLARLAFQFDLHFAAKPVLTMMVTNSVRLHSLQTQCNGVQEANIPPTLLVVDTQRSSRYCCPNCIVCPSKSYPEALGFQQEIRHIHRDPQSEREGPST